MLSGDLSKPTLSKPGLQGIHLCYERGSLAWKWCFLSTTERFNCIRRTPAYLTPLPAVDRQHLLLIAPFSVSPLGALSLFLHYGVCHKYNIFVFRLAIPYFFLTSLWYCAAGVVSFRL